MYTIYLNYLDCNEVIMQTNDRELAEQISNNITTQHHIGWFTKN